MERARARAGKTGLAALSNCLHVNALVYLRASATRSAAIFRG